MIKMYFIMLVIYVIGMKQKIFVSTSNVTFLRNKTSMHNFSRDSNTIEELRYALRDIEIMTSFINLIRRNVKPQPSNMRRLVWSKNLAKLAEEWAINCQNKFGPAGCLENITQLIYYEPEDNFFRSVTPFFKWNQERKNYDYNTNRCINGYCENYKKLVGYKSHSIGCSRMKCGADNIMNFVVCNIYPKVNLRKHLYKTGEPCQCDLTENDYCEATCAKSGTKCSPLCAHQQKVPEKISECKTYLNIIDMSNENTEKSRGDIDDSDGATDERNGDINKPNSEIDESHGYIDKLNRNTVKSDSDISKLNGALNKSNGNIDNIDESYHYTSIYNNKDKNKSNTDIDMDKENIDIGITDESKSDISKSNDDAEESVGNTDKSNSDNKLNGITDELNDDTISSKSNSVTDKSNNDTSKPNGKSHGDIDKSDGSTDMSSSDKSKLNVVTDEYYDYRVELNDDIGNSNKDTDILNGPTDGSKSDINKSNYAINKSNSVNNESDGDTNEPNDKTAESHGDIDKSDGSTDMSSSDKSKLNVVTDEYYDYRDELNDDIDNSNKDTDTLNGATDGSKSDINKSNDINKLNSVNDETDGDIDKSNGNINKNNDNSDKSSDIMEETSSESSLRSSGIILMKNSQLKILIFILTLELLIWRYEEMLQIFIMI